MRDGLLFISLLFLGVLISAQACGRKGPPSLPKKMFALRVVDLKGAWEEGYISLKGRINAPEGPIGAGMAKDLVTGCRVYYQSYPLKEAPCAGCPIEYHRYHGFGAEVVGKEGFICKVPVKSKGEIYFLKVHLIGRGGALGPPSESIKVVVD